MDTGFRPFESADLELDIAIVGAGVSGAYAAWRLKASHPEKRIGLFELSNRIGGRLYSKTLPGMPHVQAELGGMRFIPEMHKLVAGLVDHLELPTRPFPMGAPAPIGADNNIMYLRGRLLRVRDLSDSSKVPYNVRETERGKNPESLQGYVVQSLFPNASAFTPEDWFHATALNGVRLCDWGFWNLLYEVLGSEAYQFMHDAGGYYTNVANANAASSLPITEFKSMIVYCTLEHGYQQLPSALVDRFVRVQKGQYFANHRLASLSRTPGQPYTLHFVRTHTTSSRTTDLPDPAADVQAHQIILAMPRRSLELIHWAALKDDDWLRENIASVIIQPALKLFLAYDYPWWRSLELSAGRSITDMPIRQTYYFGTEGEQGGLAPDNLNSLLMASYNDVGAVPFWKGLELGDPFEGRQNRFVAAGEKPVPPHDFTVTREMVRQAQVQLQEVHGLKFIPEPYSAIYHDWTEDPYGGGWHSWKAGFEFWKVMKQMRKPIANEDIYICGEAYSVTQGWVEGALQTAERMLQENFGLARPAAWLPADYDLGP